MGERTLSDLDQGQTPATETPPPVGTTAPTTDPPAPKVYDEAYVKGLRTEAANYRIKLKEYEAAEEERKQAEMTEAQKLQARAEAAEAKAKALEVDAIRAKAANAHKLPENLHKFITAETEAEATAQAKELAESLKPAGDLPPSGGRNPAHGGEQGQKAADEARLKELQSRIPALYNRTLKG